VKSLHPPYLHLAVNFAFTFSLPISLSLLVPFSSLCHYLYFCLWLYLYFRPTFDFTFSCHYVIAFAFTFIFGFTFTFTFTLACTVRVLCLFQVIDTLPSMMNALRMVWIISRHYNRDERMVPLMAMIAWELAERVQRVVTFRTLFEYVASVVVYSCRHV